MKIDEYAFGRITINGSVYTRDVIIFPDHVLSPWWRERGHELSLADVGPALDSEPDLLIIGTGSSGLMKVPEPVRKTLEERTGRLVVVRTGEAGEYFNREAGTRAVAALHLTC